MIDDAWIEELKVRGLAAPLSLALDLLEPLGLVGAQVLWVVQPVSSLLGASALVGGLADVLEQPEGIENLRRRLNEESGGES
jgi:hypothetical protein